MKTSDETLSPMSFEHLVLGACRMSARRSGKIRSVTVVVLRRSTYAELLRCRQVAEQLGLTLAVVDSGVTLRPKLQPAAVPRRVAMEATEPRGMDRVQAALLALTRRVAHAFNDENKWPKGAMR